MYTFMSKNPQITVPMMKNGALDPEHNMLCQFCIVADNLAMKNNRGGAQAELQEEQRPITPGDYDLNRLNSDGVDDSSREWDSGATIEEIKCEEEEVTVESELEEEVNAESESEEEEVAVSRGSSSPRKG